MKKGNIVLYLVILVLALSLGACASTGIGKSNLEFIGNVWPNGIGADVEESYLWNQITPENAGKWSTVESARDEPDWDQLDKAYGYAKERGIPFRLHTLIWGQQFPAWIADLPVDEQEEEILEWFTGLSERYPDVDFIDVVNEPVHVVPPFAEALGGAGETGYDWVIRSFELAREFFPNSKLHINDYNILTDKSDMENYLVIIDLLKERDLIDGIGLQGHSLERATISLVQEKLDRLTDTQLPLYVTELEIALRDDILQAQQFSALISLFAEHPSVKGVTLWGFKEARMWRKMGYLIGRDGSFRVAMEWLQAFQNGEKYVIPEYVPQPRTGTDAALRLEAEDYDTQNGVNSAGSVIADVDGGDWVGFNLVEFRDVYNSVRIRYGKGSEGTSDVKIVFVKPDGYEALKIPLENTGGWNNFADVEMEWPPISGQYDVFFVFDGGTGVGNIDYIEFFVPGANAVLPFVDSEKEESEGGLLLQPETADEIVGIETDEVMISYLDDSDYVGFKQVDFGSGMTRLLVKYAKESTTLAGVELRLDSLEGDPLISFRLNATGGWNDFLLSETTFEPISGVHDLYVTFRLEDTTGVGNFDWFWFFEE